MSSNISIVAATNVATYPSSHEHEICSFKNQHNTFNLTVDLPVVDVIS